MDNNVLDLLQQILLLSSFLMYCDAFVTPVEICNALCIRLSLLNIGNIIRDYTARSHIILELLQIIHTRDNFWSSLKIVLSPYFNPNELFDNFYFMNTHVGTIHPHSHHLQSRQMNNSFLWTQRISTSEFQLSAK